MSLSIDIIRMTPCRPYLIRALYEWILNNQLTPHVMIDAFVPGVSVPENHIKDGRIVLNISPDAVGNLEMTNEWVNFNARFSGVQRYIRLPVSAILGIYAIENGRGMMFEHEDFTGGDNLPPTHQSSAKAKKRPQLKIVK